mgnify:CR=1 FL=1
MWTPGYKPLLAAFAVVAVFCTVLGLAKYLWRYLEARKSKRSPKTFVVVDGSNVMHWKDGAPDIDTLRTVVNRLRDKGFTPGVMFDANAGYLLTGKYRHDRFFSDALGLPQDQIMVVPKGTPADPMILKFARDNHAPVVSNDRFRDWAEEFPDIVAPDHLITGGYTQGALWLQLPQDSTKPA